MEFHEPESLDELLALLARYGDEGRLIAGGTALVQFLKQRLIAPAALISLRRVPGLDYIEATDGLLRIGALVRHRAMERSEVARSWAPLLPETYRRVATVRVRNVATVGGGLAHGDPNQDPPPSLLALEARVRLVSAQGTREVPLTAFFRDYYETALEPQELLAEVLVPPLPARTGYAYTKFLPRTADDYATVAVAALVTVTADGTACERARIALGAVASTPIRAFEAERLLEGQPLTAEAFASAGEAAARATDPLDDYRGSAEYKRAMAAVMTRRTLEAATQRAREVALA